MRETVEGRTDETEEFCLVTPRPERNWEASSILLHFLLFY
jgi:hypothetical protein